MPKDLGSPEQAARNVKTASANIDRIAPVCAGRVATVHRVTELTPTAARIPGRDFQIRQVHPEDTNVHFSRFIVCLAALLTAGCTEKPAPVIVGGGPAFDPMA